MSGDDVGNDRQVIICYKQGKAIDRQTLDAVIQSAWSEAIADPKEREDIASVLAISTEQLSSFPPPVRAFIAKSGVTGAEVAIVIATPFVTAFLAQLGKEAGKAAGTLTWQAAQKVWPILWRRIRKHQPEALGPEITAPRTTKPR